jgi:hypothetical protein
MLFRRYLYDREIIDLKNIINTYADYAQQFALNNTSKAPLIPFKLTSITTSNKITSNQ